MSIFSFKAISDNTFKIFKRFIFVLYQLLAGARRDDISRYPVTSHYEPHFVQKDKDTVFIEYS